jgi:hypothetical protein
MHFLFLLLRLVVDRLIPGWRDGLAMAARADGRVEHVPTWPAWWDRWLSFMGRKAPGGRRERRKVRAERGAARWRGRPRSQ